MIPVAAFVPHLTIVMIHCCQVISHCSTYYFLLQVKQRAEAKGEIQELTNLHKLIKYWFQLDVSNYTDIYIPHYISLLWKVCCQCNWSGLISLLQLYNWQTFITLTLSLLKVQQGRTGNEKDMSSVSVHTSKPDFTSPVSLYKSASSQVTRYHLPLIFTFWDVW